jgi:hypothetical protein
MIFMMPFTVVFERLLGPRIHPLVCLSFRIMRVSSRG